MIPAARAAAAEIFRGGKRMTRKNISILAVLCLSIALLYTVSARVGQPEAQPKETVIEEPDDWVQPTPAQPVEPTPEPTPEKDPELEKFTISDWMYTLVDERHSLGQSFAPDVAATENGQYFDSRAVDALESMLAAAREAGFEVYLSAAYRPYSSQAYMFYGRASQIAYGGTVSYPEAEQLARQYVAYPGTSEHQLGLAADIIDSASTTLDTDTLKDAPLIVWLRENCADFGFIQRFPEDKEEITGRFEPWHFRYVGEEAAKYIMEKGLSLEEFRELCES